MHEMSLCEGILNILQKQSKIDQYSTVKTVVLEIGRLSSIEPDALRFAFSVVMKGSIAENARLNIIDIAGQAWCLHCQKQVVINQRYDGCPLCGGYPLQITEGQQMRIKELEVL